MKRELYIKNDALINFVFKPLEKTKNIFCQLLLIFSILFSVNTLVAQATDSIYTHTDSILVKTSKFTTDKLRQVYIVTEDNQLIKYNESGKELFRFNNNTLGEIGHIDATDPFNILIYYPDFLTVITLDRTLNITSEFNLYDLDIVEVKAIGMSNDNNIWLYDDVSFKIKKIDRQGKLLEESEDLSMHVAQSIQANFILERENWVYVNDPDIGILVFSNYGQFFKIIDIKELTQFQVIENQLLYSQEGKLFSFHLRSLLTREIPLPQQYEKEDLSCLQKNMLYLMKDDRVDIFTF